MAEINRMTMTQVMAYYYEIKREDYLKRADDMDNQRLAANAKPEEYRSVTSALRKAGD